MLARGRCAGAMRRSALPDGAAPGRGWPEASRASGPGARAVAHGVFVVAGRLGAGGIVAGAGTLLWSGGEDAEAPAADPGAAPVRAPDVPCAAGGPGRPADAPSIDRWSAIGPVELIEIVVVRLPAGGSRP